MFDKVKRWACDQAAWSVGGITALGLLLLAAAAPGSGAPAVPAKPSAAPDAGVAASTGATGAAAPAGGYALSQEARFSERRNAGGGWDRRVIEPAFHVVRLPLADKRVVDLLIVQRLDSTSHSDAEARSRGWR